MKSKFLVARAALCSSLLAVGAIAKSKSEIDIIHFSPGTGWKVGNHREIPKEVVITEFIREGDDIDNWKELLTVQMFTKTRKDGSPEDWLNKQKAIREQTCPGSTQWNVIDKSESSILYEWRAKPCLGWPDQHEIARIFDGRYTRFFMHYVRKVPELPAETRTEWIKKFSDATTQVRSY